ncbi:MAG: hypothetical protein LBT79_01840 [Elusimicrobiota bacterium]|nr:hypothetical protein [Elusimicrobiota bacterium]
MNDDERAAIELGSDLMGYKNKGKSSDSNLFQSINNQQKDSCANIKQIKKRLLPIYKGSSRFNLAGKFLFYYAEGGT